MRRLKRIKFVWLAGWCIGWSLALATAASAHCDTLDGPVAVEAKQALEKGDVTPVLKWVPKGDEPEIRAAFQKARAVRGKGKEARELADAYFLETLVRVHRAGEGAPYTGLKPAGTDPGPGIRAADQALAGGSVDDLVKMLTDLTAAGVRQRFSATMEKKKQAADSVEKGREYVAAYVDFVHYVEKLFIDAIGPSPHCVGNVCPVPPPSGGSKPHGH